MTRWYGAILGLALGAMPLIEPAWAQSPRREAAVRTSTGGPAGGSVVDLSRPTGRAARQQDRSGRTRDGLAGVMDARFGGRRLDDGGPYDPDAAIAASRVLPVGTTARITNLANGQVMLVQIRDRGTSAGDRIIEVSPAVARSLGLSVEAPVRVAPLAVPQADGSIRLGEGTGLDGQLAAPPASERPPEWG